MRITFRVVLTITRDRLSDPPREREVDTSALVELACSDPDGPRIGFGTFAPQDRAQVLKSS